jgi:hypothetical protein
MNRTKHLSLSLSHIIFNRLAEPAAIPGEYVIAMWFQLRSLLQLIIAGQSE